MKTFLIFLSNIAFSAAIFNACTGVLSHYSQGDYLDKSAVERIITKHMANK